MTKQRTDRLNSLLKEVISEVIRRDIKHAAIPDLVTITRVDITKDLRFAKVFVSMIGTDQEKEAVVARLQELAPTITHIASRKVVMRYFPALTFKSDQGLSNQLRIEELLHEISEERESREDDDSAPQT